MAAGSNQDDGRSIRRRKPDNDQPNLASSPASEDRRRAQGLSFASWLARLPILVWDTLTSIMAAWFLNETRLIQPRNPGSIEASIEVDGSDTKWTVNQWIRENVPSLQSKYRPTWWLPNGHFQTGYMVAGDFTKIDQVKYIRTTLRVPDGGTLGFDFTPPSHDSLPPTTPTIVVCHGLTGGSHESYVRSVLARIIKPVQEGGLGVRAVVINSRGCAGVPLTSDQLYSAGTTLDLSTALHYLRAAYPQSPLHGIGFSLGAAFLTRYFGEASSASLLSSGIVLGNPGNMPCMAVRLDTHWFYSRVYSRAMASNLVNLFFKHYTANPNIWDKSKRFSKADLDKLREMRKGGVTLKTVDGPLTAKLGGPVGDGLWPFADADVYYEYATPHKTIEGVKRPLLWVSSMDDPIIDSSCSPIKEIQASSHVFMALTARGGHLGWFTGNTASERWITQPVMEFFWAGLRDLPLAGAAVEVVRGSMQGPAEKDWEKVSRDLDTRHSDKSDDEYDWEWVKNLAHNVQGVPDGRLGWRVLARGEVIHGEEGTGTLQGL